MFGLVEEMFTKRYLPLDLYQLSTSLCSRFFKYSTNQSTRCTLPHLIGRGNFMYSILLGEWSEFRSYNSSWCWIAKLYRLSKSLGPRYSCFRTPLLNKRSVGQPLICKKKRERINQYKAIRESPHEQVKYASCQVIHSLPILPKLIPILFYEATSPYILLPLNGMLVHCIVAPSIEFANVLKNASKTGQHWTKRKQTTFQPQKDPNRKTEKAF